MMFNVNNSVKESLERMEAAGRGRIRVISFPTMASAELRLSVRWLRGLLYPRTQTIRMKPSAC